MADENTRLLEAARGGRFRNEMTLLSEAVLPADTWLFHISNDAESIARTGFAKGSVFEANLALAYGAASTAPGYNFALLADDAYHLQTLVEYDFANGQYEAILFRSAGVHLRHYDDFDQVCFWGPDADGPFVRLVMALDPNDEDNEATLDEEPHTWPWNVVDAEGVVVSEHEDLLTAIDGGIAYGEKLIENRALSPAP